MSFNGLFKVSPYLLLLVLLASLSLPACSSARKELGLIPPMEEVEAMTYFIADNLELEQDQIFKVREIVKQSIDMKIRIYNQYRNRTLEIQERQRVRMDRFDYQIELLLNSDQQKKYRKVLRKAIRNKEFSRTSEQEKEQFLRPNNSNYQSPATY